MPVPELALRAAMTSVESFCRLRVPATLRDQMRLEAKIRGNSITVMERRPPWGEGIGSEWTSLKIAQLRYDPQTALWSLYWSDSNDRWLHYADAIPARSVDALMEAIDDDRSSVFFG
jgi:Protein of unknown function (DUF3024)